VNAGIFFNNAAFPTCFCLTVHTHMQLLATESESFILKKKSSRLKMFINLLYNMVLWIAFPKFLAFWLHKGCPDTVETIKKWSKRTTASTDHSFYSLKHFKVNLWPWCLFIDWWQDYFRSENYNSSQMLFVAGLLLSGLKKSIVHLSECGLSRSGQIHTCI